MPEPAAQIAVVGAGPRGTVVLERICANASLVAPGQRIDVHLIDPWPHGGGRVWRTGQNRHVVMNTVAGDITVFTDDSVRCAGAIRPGPTQYQFARMLAAGEIEGFPGWAVAEARAMRPWSYASRAFQGCYLGWALQHIIDTAPPQVRVMQYRMRAVSLKDVPGGRQLLWLDGQPTPLEVDAVVLSMGHIDVAPTSGQQALQDFATRHGGTYLPPASPGEVDLSGIRAGEPVILRGLGLNFFDYMVLLTVDRGGSFDRRSGRLVYRPSGQEPVLYAGSGRGVPYTARAEIRQEIVPRYQPRFLTGDVIRALRHAAGTGCGDFMTDLWPYIAKETGWVYYRHLLRGEPAALARFEASYPALTWGSEQLDALLAELVPNADDRWDWDQLDRPTIGRHFAGRPEYLAWIKSRLREDYVNSTLGPAGSALKATAAMLRDLRDEVRQVISHQGISGNSYREHIDRWFSGLNNYVASGPPAFRIEELSALADVGIVRFVGPDMGVTADSDRGLFLAHSPAVDGPPVAAAALIEAHLPLIDLRRTTDPLLRDLLQAGQCRPHRMPNADGTEVETGGLDITEGSQRVIGTDGSAHRGRFSYGPPVESVQWVTAIGARPHVNSRTLLQGDAIARGALATAMDNLHDHAAVSSMHLVCTY